MDREFTLYPEAFELKELGFDESCLGYFDGLKQLHFCAFENMSDKGFVSALIYSQAFRWFREKHNYHVIIDFNQSKNNKWYYGIIQIDHNISVSPDVEFETYEEAELAALKELIKTIKDRT